MGDEATSLATINPKGSVRLRHGELDPKVLGLLRAAQEAAVTPQQVANALGRTWAVCRSALERLADAGLAVRVSERPWLYRAAASPVPPIPAAPPVGGDRAARLVVMVTERGEYAEAAAVAYYPGGCPTRAPEANGYEGPHRATVCPRCVEQWQNDHQVGWPVYAPSTTAEV